MESIVVLLVTYFGLLAIKNVTGLLVTDIRLFIVALSVTLLRWIYLHHSDITDKLQAYKPEPKKSEMDPEMSSQWRATKVTRGATIPLRAERIQDQWRDYYKREMFTGAHIDTPESSEPLHVQDYVPQDNYGMAIPGEPVSIREPEQEITNDAGCAWGELETDMAPETYGGRQYAPDLATAKGRCEKDPECKNVAHVRVNGDDTYTYGSERLVERKDIKTDMIFVSDHNALQCFRNKK
jgi:hypothetical protein